MMFPSCTTAAAVSSQDVSMPRIFIRSLSLVFTIETPSWCSAYCCLNRRKAGCPYVLGQSNRLNATISCNILLSMGFFAVWILSPCPYLDPYDPLTGRFALKNLTHKEGVFIHGCQSLQDIFGGFIRHNGNHSYSIVKCPHHFIL